MAIKKKKPGKTSGRKTKKPVSKKKAAPKKKAAVKKPARKKAVAKKKAATTPRKRGKRQPLYQVSVKREGLRARSGGQSGDLQGLSNVERADSESVDELLEEGNAFEAEFLHGVEDAGARAEREVHTRELPEDDIPGEYLDKD